MSRLLGPDLLMRSRKRVMRLRLDWLVLVVFYAHFRVLSLLLPRGLIWNGLNVCWGINGLHVIRVALAGVLVLERVNARVI